MNDRMDREIADLFKQLDKVHQVVAIATLCALVGGASPEEAIGAGNAVLVANGREPIDPANVLNRKGAAQ